MSENKNTNNTLGNEENEISSMTVEECEKALLELEEELNAYSSSVCEDEPTLEIGTVYDAKNESTDEGGFKTLDGEKASGDGADFAFTLTDTPEGDARAEAIAESDRSSAVAYLDEDELFVTAARLVVSEGVVSAPFLQRTLKIGYGRAANMIDRLEELCIISPLDGNRGRRVIVSPERLERILASL